MRKKWKKKIESVSHRQQYPSDSSSASESSVSEDSCSSEQQETTPYARSGSSLNPLRWRNQTFDVDGTVEPQESNYCRHRKGIQADFQRDENKETNVAVSNAPPPRPIPSSKPTLPRSSCMHWQMLSFSLFSSPLMIPPILLPQRMQQWSKNQ